jgi:hypothetical protein
MICRTRERDEYPYKILVGKPEGKDQLGNSAVGYRCCSLVGCFLRSQHLNYSLWLVLVELLTSDESERFEGKRSWSTEVVYRNLHAGTEVYHK